MASGDSQGPDDLREKEELTPSTGDSNERLESDAADSEREQVENLNQDEGGWKTNVSNKSPKIGVKKRFGTASKLWLGGGSAMVVISLVFGFFSFMQPFKAESIIKSIESRVGEVPQHAVERRLEYYMIRYLMLRAAEKADVNFEKNRSYVYIGDGVFKTLYTNWRGANLETKLETEYKIRIRPEKPVGQLFGRQLTQPTNWRVEYLDQIDRSTGKPRVEVLNSRQMTLNIAEFTKAETKSYQIMKREHMRELLAKYYGFRRYKTYEKLPESWREKIDPKLDKAEVARLKYEERKLSFKKTLITNTIGRISVLRANQLNCILEGGDNCKPENMNPPDTGDENVAEDIAKAIEDDSKNPDAPGKGLLSQQIQKLGLKSLLSGAVAGGVKILEFFGNLTTIVQTGALSLMTYQTLAQGSIGFATTYASGSDQFRAGEDFEDVDAQIMNETLQGYEESPIYASAENNRTKVSAAAQYMGDCDGDGKDETTLPPGETACPNMWLLQTQETIKNLFFWPVVAGIGVFYNSTIGQPIKWASDLFSKALELTGVTGVINELLSVTGADKALESVLESGMNYIIGFSITGAETGKRAYELIFMGIFVRNSVLGSTMNGSREGTIGGAPLSDQEVGVIMADDRERAQFALNRKPLVERYFSPSVDSSLTSYAILHTPTSITEMSNSFLASINPVSLFENLGSILTPRSFAAPNTSLQNPFHGVTFGYRNNSEAYDMEEEDLNAKYQCSLPVMERPQNKKMGRPNVGPDNTPVPFDIFIDEDPCLLNKTAGEAGSMFFTGGYNEVNN